jgi:nucleoside-diphosphate-sugar epimerase
MERESKVEEEIVTTNHGILVTGSNRFIGAKVVEFLLERGFCNLRCFVRPSSQLGRLNEVLGRYETGRRAEVVSGDLLSRSDCRRAAEGISVIYHLAAGIEKSFAGAFMNSALATRNLMEAFRQEGKPGRPANVSPRPLYSFDAVDDPSRVAFRGTPTFT